MKRMYIDTKATDSMEEAAAYNKIATTYYYWLNRPQAKLALKLLKRKNMKSPSILDIGCGPALIPIRIAEKIPDCKIHAVDISKNMLKLARENSRKVGVEEKIVFESADGENLGYADNAFDMVMCSSTLHHQEDPVPLLSEMKRVAKKDGIIIITDHTRPISLLALNLFVNIFGIFYDKTMKKEYRDTLSSAFTVKELKKMLGAAGIANVNMFRSFPHAVIFVRES